jgi:hypothetical protein
LPRASSPDELPSVVPPPSSAVAAGSLEHAPIVTALTIGEATAIGRANGASKRKKRDLIARI